MDQYFQISPVWEIAVCKECKYGVWPAHISQHLIKQHRIRGQEARTVQVIAKSHPQLLQEQRDWRTIHHANEIIPELEIYSAHQCTQCPHIRLNQHSIEQHWSHKHPGQRGRRGRKRDKASISRPIQAQRMFVQGHGSNFFSVGIPIIGNPVPIDAIAEAQQRAQQAQQAVHDRTLQAIQDREEGTEFIPWLETMGWPIYLAGIDRKELI